MIRLSRSQLQPIGLDIGRDGIHMMQLEVVGNELAVYAAARGSFSPEAKAQPNLHMALAGDLIKRLLREGRFSGRSVVAAVPREMVHIKNCRFPMMPLEELESVVKYEARNLFSFDVDDAQIRAIPAGEVRQGNDVVQEVMVVGLRNEDVNNFVEQVHRFGVTLAALDLEQCALYRTVERFMRRREDEHEVHVLVDIGMGHTQIVIGKGREISFLKTIDIGGHHLQEAVSRRLEISLEEAQSLRRRLGEEGIKAGEQRDPVRQAVIDATRSLTEQLAREIAMCLRYYLVTFRGNRPSKVRLMGGEGGDPQLQACLNSILNLPVETGRPLFNVDSSRMKVAQRQGAMSEWAVAMGLGLRMTTGKYKARDGRPRGSSQVPLSPGADGALPGEEKAMEPAGAAAGSAAATRRQEVTHA